MGESILKKNLKSYLILFPVAAGIVALDQWTKSLVRDTLAFGEIWSPWAWLTPYARVVHWSNTGVAFGMFQNNNILFTILVSIIALVIIIFNVADASVTIGVGIMILGLWVQENKQRKKNKVEVPEPKEIEQR
jgi:signal peptidase II